MRFWRRLSPRRVPVILRVIVLPVPKSDTSAGAAARRSASDHPRISAATGHRTRHRARGAAELVRIPAAGAGQKEQAAPVNRCRL